MSSTVGVRQRRAAANDDGSVSGNPATGTVPAAASPGLSGKKAAAFVALAIAAAVLVAVAVVPSSLFGACPVALRNLFNGWSAPDSLWPLGTPSRWFTREELKAYDGASTAPGLMLSVGGEVYDVREGAQFYGPDGPYRMFAAQDSTRALSKGSLAEEDWKGDAALSLEDFTEQDWAAVEEQVRFYRGKYRVVGGLVDGAAVAEHVARRLGGVALQAWQKRQVPATSPAQQA